MAPKRCIASIWAVSMVGILSGACSTTQVREKDSQIQSLQSQILSQQSQIQSLESETVRLKRELELQRNKEKKLMSQLQLELDTERKKVQELKTQLEAIHPPLEGEALSPSELVAVPERYVDKDVIVEGKLGASVFFREPGGYFVLKALEGNRSILCFFRMQDLDVVSRRLLAAKQPLEKTRVAGRLIKSSNGLAKEIGIRTKSGYEFHVTKMEN